MALTAWQSLWKLKNPKRFQVYGLPEENPYTDRDLEEEIEAHKWWLRHGTSGPDSNFREGGSIVSIPGADYVWPDDRWFEEDNAPSWTYGRYDRGYRNVPSASMGGGPSDLAESKAAAVPRKGFLGRGLNTKAFWEAMAEQEPYVDQTTAPPGGFVGESRVQGPVGTGKITPYGVAGGAESLAEYIKRIKKEGGLIA